MLVCVFTMCMLVALRDQKRLLNPLNWRYRELLTIMLMLGTEEVQ